MRKQSWQIAGNLHMSEASGRNSKGWVDSECYVNYRLFISLKKCKHSSILVENNSFQLFVRITIFPPDVAFVESESQEWTSLVNRKFLVSVTSNPDCSSV